MPSDSSNPDHPSQNPGDAFAIVTRQISEAATSASREPGEIRLIAVSKKHPADRIAKMAVIGQRDFGENYLQEAQDKMETLSDTRIDGDPLVWHFIGHIQSRKCAEIARHFDWVHTVASVKVARKLSQHRASLDDPAPLNVLIQINIDDEESKSGITPDQLETLANDILTLPSLRLRGLMVIPKPEDDSSRQRAVFGEVRQLLERLRGAIPPDRADDLDQLSMGMTADMQAAIAEGATMVRIGTALFGQREYPTSS